MRTPGKKPRFRRPKYAPRRRSAASRRPDGLRFNVFNLPLHSAAHSATCGGASAASVRSGAVPGATGTTLEISGTTLVFPGTTLVFRAAAPVFRAKDEKRDTRGGCPSFDCSNLQKTGETAKSALRVLTFRGVGKAYAYAPAPPRPAPRKCRSSVTRLSRFCHIFALLLQCRSAMGRKPSPPRATNAKHPLFPSKTRKRPGSIQNQC